MPALPRQARWWRRSQAAVRDLWIGGVLLAIVVAFSIGSPYFLTRANWINTSSTATEVLLLAVGETFVICSGGIDLSARAALGFAGTVGAWVMATGFAGAARDRRRRGQRRLPWPRSPLEARSA